ncbi:hypothetical protein DM02DRAFT_731989 [Periconia macrospinosa]|uniref:Uncharacterized protein n=1 Tax=Periconia macrospinosa TaxID=97972 RepID=A0A2V1DAW4_9PLEO|nr:hypothetical protein DM02DRAFT_731989 [Periconia macrospinosa]
MCFEVYTEWDCGHVSPREPEPFEKCDEELGSTPCEEFTEYYIKVKFACASCKKCEDQRDKVVQARRDAAEKRSMERGEAEWEEKKAKMKRREMWDALVTQRLEATRKSMAEATKKAETQRKGLEALVEEDEVNDGGGETGKKRKREFENRGKCKAREEEDDVEDKPDEYEIEEYDPEDYDPVDYDLGDYSSRKYETEQYGDDEYEVEEYEGDDYGPEDYDMDEDEAYDGEGFVHYRS